MTITTAAEADLELRRRAEAQFLAETATSQLFTPETPEQLLYELQVHQIEQEMQNEELRRSQADLAAERSRYFELYDLAPVGYLTMSEKGLIQRVNLAAAGMIGVPRNMLLNQPASQFIFPEDQNAYFRRLKLLRESGDLQSWEMRMKRSDGTYFWTQLQVTLSPDGEYWLTASDISERKRAEAELYESISRFDQLALQSRTVVWEVDAQGLITYISHVSETVFGYRPDEIVNRMHFYDLHPESGRKTFKEAALAVFNRKEQFSNLENRMQTKDGRIVWVSTNGIPHLDTDGTLLGYHGSDTDITEKKSILEQLLHSQKMESIGELAGGLSHDLNNILSVVNGYATLAQLELDKDQKAFRYLDEITRATTRAAVLTHSMLAYSRKQEMNQQKQDLNHLITTVGSFIKRIIHDNITFTLVLQNDALLVSVDTVQFEQVLLNLAANARDAMPDGGVFSIAAVAVCIDEQLIASHGYGVPGRYALITVSDTGTGMDEKTRNKVFDPFFTTKEVGKGTGLGLAMVMGIIKQHDGFIDLRSEPGTGSIFHLFLPLLDPEAVVATPVEQKIQIEQHNSGVILVAEDDADTRGALEEFLTRYGYTIIAAVDGQDAVEKFAARKDEIDLVISDIVMPRKSGKAASDEIRQMSEDMKFIFISGYANNVIEREGGLGADAEILSKPIMPFVMLGKIKELVPVSKKG